MNRRELLWIVVNCYESSWTVMNRRELLWIVVNCCARPKLGTVVRYSNIFLYQMEDDFIYMQMQLTNLLFLKLIGGINFNRHIYWLFTNERWQPCVLTCCEQLQCISVVVNSREQSRRWNIFRLYDCLQLDREQSGTVGNKTRACSHYRRNYWAQQFTTVHN